MKILISTSVAISLLVFTGCSTTPSAGRAKADSETVMVTYHVQSGKEALLQALLAHAWKIYRREHMVSVQPHVVIRDADAEGQSKFVEIFTWAKSPDHPPENVLTIWKQEQSLCEPRDGHRGIEGGEVALVTEK
jgi:hypothetical protein